MSTYCENDWYETIPCASCGVRFGVPTSFVEKRRQDKETFYCPNGHHLSYHTSEVDRLRKEVARKNQMLDSANARASTMERERDQATVAHRKMRQRIVNGACPCCNRTFQNLLAHMRTEHADFKKSLPLSVVRQSFGMTQALLAKEAGVQSIHVSLMERGKPLVGYARRNLESWLERHGAKV